MSWKPPASRPITVIGPSLSLCPEYFSANELAAELSPVLIRPSPAVPSWLASINDLSSMAALFNCVQVKFNGDVDRIKLLFIARF